MRLPLQLQEIERCLSNHKLIIRSTGERMLVVHVDKEWDPDLEDYVGSVTFEDWADPAQHWETPFRGRMVHEGGPQPVQPDPLVDLDTPSSAVPILQGIADLFDIPATSYSPAVLWRAFVEILQEHRDDPYVIGLGSKITDRGYKIAHDKDCPSG